MAKTPLEEIFKQEERSKIAIERQALKAPIFGKVFEENQTSAQSFIEKVGGEVLKPYAKTMGSIASATKGVYKFAESGIRYALGDKKGAMTSVLEAGQPVEVDLGFYGRGELGKVEPFKNEAEAIGSGIQIGFNAVGFEKGKEYLGMLNKSGVFTVLKNYWGKIAVAEGISGAGEEVGRGIAEEVTDTEELIKRGSIGGAFGAVGSLVAIPVFSGIKNVFNFIRKGGHQFTKEIIEEAIEEGTEEATEKIPFIKTVLGEDVKISKADMPENTKKIAGFFGVSEEVVERGERVITEQVAVGSLDEPVQHLINSGIGDNEVNLMMQASNADTKIFNNMLDSAQASKTTWRTVKRPVEYVGDTVLDRVKHVNVQTTVYTKSLNKIIDEMPANPIEVTNVYDTFMERLGKDIDVDESGKLIFDTSRYSGKNSGPIRQMLQEVHDLIKPDKNSVTAMTPQRIRTVRQQLFDTLKLGQQQQVSLPTADYTVNEVRKSLHDIMGSLSSKYKSTSLKLAQMIEINKEFYGLIGKQWTMEAEDIVSLRAGEVMNRILGNASARPLNTLNKLELIATQTGFDDDVDILKLINFNDRLEDLYGTTQTRGFAGGVQRGTEQAMSQMKGLMGPGNIQNKLLQFGSGSIDMITGTRDEDKISAIRNYIDWRLK